MVNYGPCENCGKPIEIAIFRGTGWCSEICRKILNGELQPMGEYNYADYISS